MATDERTGAELTEIGVIASRVSLPKTIQSSSVDEDAEAERKAVRHMVGMQVPAHLRHATLDSFDPEPDVRALNLVREWVRAMVAWKERGRPSGGPSVLLTSERRDEAVAPGNGKSHLAVAALFALADAGVGRVYKVESTGDAWCSLMWTTSADLIASIRATYGRGGRTAEEVVARYLWADVLVLDDIGTESSSEDATAHLFRLIDSRIGKPTFYTSNYSPADLRKRSPEWAKLASRMSANLKGAVLKGPDRRRPQQGTDAWGEWV